jgi:hypothetical protein
MCSMNNKANYGSKLHIFLIFVLFFNIILCFLAKLIRRLTKINKQLSKQALPQNR